MAHSSDKDKGKSFPQPSFMASQTKSFIVKSYYTPGNHLMPRTRMHVKNENDILNFVKKTKDLQKV